MKYLVNSVIALFLCSNIFGQIDSKALLKVSPIQFADSKFELSYEHYFGDFNKSIHISPMFYLKKKNSEEFKGVQLELQYRIYLANLKREETATWIFSDIRMYTGVYVHGVTYSQNMDYYMWDPITQTEDYENHERTTDAAEGGVLVGMQFFISNKVALDLQVGGGIRYSENTDTYEDRYGQNFYGDASVFDIEYFGVKPKLNLQLGITL